MRTADQRARTGPEQGVPGSACPGTFLGQVDCILAALCVVFPDLGVGPEHVVHVFTGVRPPPVSDAGATSGGRPALVMRVDMGNPYNRERHREMWAVLQNEPHPILPALRMDAACVVVNLFTLPDEPALFRQCVRNIARLGNDCERCGMPLMIEPLVMQPNERGGHLVDGDTETVVTLVRLARELGADLVKADPTDDPADFRHVVKAARCPVLVRGGGKADLRRVLDASAALLTQGAHGMVCGRTIDQHESPGAVVAALMAMIHGGADGEAAWAI